MDSLSRKRKLVELDKNITPFRKQAIAKSSATTEENDYPTTKKYQKINATSNLFNPTDVPIERHSPIEEEEEEEEEDDDDDETEHKERVSTSNLGKRPLSCCYKKSGWSIMFGKPSFSTTEAVLVKVVQGKSTPKLETIMESCENDTGNEEEEDRHNGASFFYGERSKQIDLVIDNDRKDTRMWFSTEYIEDIISHEVYKESLYQLSDNFCRKYDINPTGREILIDWLIHVQVHLKAENSALHLAVALLDIMLDSIQIPLNELQAAAMAAFWVAYKFIHGSISVKTLMSLCAGSVTKEMIEDHEILVLQTSRLIQAGGSLTVFFNYLLYKIFGFKFPPEIYYCGLYFIEIMLLQFVFVDCPAYEKAVTAVFTALALFGWPARFDFAEVSKFITKRKLKHIYRRLMRFLRLMYKDKESLKNSSVYRKYKSSRYLKISVHQKLKCLASA